MIQLKRAALGEISGLEYGQLGVEIAGSGGYGKLYVGTSLGASAPIISEPYFPEGILLNNDNAYIKWDDSGMLGYSLDLLSDNLIDLHSKTVRIYSGSNGDEMTGYFGAYVQLRDEDNTSSISLNQGVRLGSSNQPIQLFALQGDISMQANEVSLTSIDGPINLQSSNDSQITMTTPQLLLTTVAALPADDAITILSPYNVLVSAAAFRCDTYPVDDSDVATKKYVDSQCYTAGNIISFSNLHVNGEVTGANKDLYVTFWLDKPIKNVSNATITQGKLQVRQNNKYIYGDSSGGADMLGVVSINQVQVNGNALGLRLYFDNNEGSHVAWPGSVNNTALQTIWMDTKIQLS